MSNHPGQSLPGMTTRRRVAEAVGLYAVLAVAAYVVYFAVGVDQPLVRRAMPSVGMALAAAVVLRLCLATRHTRLADLPFAVCPGCRYSLQGLSTPGTCPECGHHYHDHSFARREITLDHRALVRAGLAALGLLIAVLAPVPALALREWSIDEALVTVASNSYGVCVVLFVPHALCSAVIGKFFSARVFNGYWIGGLLLGLLGLLSTFLVGGADLLAAKVSVLPIPAAGAGLGLGLGCALGLAGACVATPPVSGTLPRP